MKLVNILVIVLVTFFLIIGSVFFIFGGEVLGDNFYQKFFSGELFTDKENHEDTTSSGGEFIDEISNNPENSNDIISENNSYDSGCQIKKFSYSLRNFIQNVSCQEWNSEKCVRLLANCSVDIYNLDNNSSGDFEIRYSVVDSLGNELEYKTISQNIPFNEYKLFLINFDINNNEGIDQNCHCFFDIINIPTKEICD